MSDAHSLLVSVSVNIFPNQTSLYSYRYRDAFKELLKNITCGKDCLWASALQLQSEYNPARFSHVLRKSECSRADCSLHFCFCLCHTMCPDDQRKVGRGGVGHEANSVNNIYLAGITGRNLRDRFSLLPLNNSKRTFWTRRSTWLLSKFKMYFWRVEKE